MSQRRRGRPSVRQSRLNMHLGFLNVDPNQSAPMSSASSVPILPVSVTNPPIIERKEEHESKEEFPRVSDFSRVRGNQLIMRDLPSSDRIRPPHPNDQVFDQFITKPNLSTTMSQVYSDLSEPLSNRTFNTDPTNPWIPFRTHFQYLQYKLFVKREWSRFEWDECVGNFQMSI